MTNYNERLDTILAEHREWMRGVRTDRLVGTSSEATKQALIDWHNKQVEAVLDRLESQVRRADDCTEDTFVVKAIRIEAERNKLKERSKENE